MTTKFERDTSAELRSDQGASRLYAIHLNEDWSVLNGPNGGYLAALLLRTMSDMLAREFPPRHPRLLSVNYLVPPEKGEALIEVRLQRRGRNLSTLTAAMIQNERAVLLARASFAARRPSRISFSHAPMPEAEPPEKCPPMPKIIPAHHNYDMRIACGGLPFSASDRARIGGWIRLAERGDFIEPPLVAAVSDSWPPAIFTMAESMADAIRAPTVELTIHFLSALDGDNAIEGSAWLFAVFHADSAQEGFVTEDGVIWSSSGRLLAKSRQIALAVS